MTERRSNAEAARVFRLLADLLEIGAESAYRVGAYRRAAEGIARLSEPLEERATELVDKLLVVPLTAFARVLRAPLLLRRSDPF